MSRARAAWRVSALLLVGVLAFGCASSQKRVEQRLPPEEYTPRPFVDPEAVLHDPDVVAAISPPQPSGERGRARCTTDFRFSLTAIHEQLPFDYLSIRTVFLRTSPYEGSPLRDLAQPKVEVAAQRGTPCERAGAGPDPRCLEQLASGTHWLPPVRPAYLGIDGLFVGTRGSEIHVFYSVEQLRALFGTVDTGDEALWLASRSGYRVSACAASATTDGFEIWTDGLEALCKTPYEDVDRVLLHVHADGRIDKRDKEGGQASCGQAPQP
jgi:hypothetical protein